MDDLIPMKLERGQLLISSPEIDSGLFYRSVLLLCEHNQNGSFALLINKPLEFELPEEIVNLSQSKNKNIHLRAGGPVQTSQMMLLHTQNTQDQQLLEITPGVFLGGDLLYLHTLAQTDNDPYVYLCFGYSGWAGDQLEREYLDGSWIAAQGSVKYIFKTPPHLLWRTILRDMGGRFASLSTIPEDLSLN